MLGINLLLAFSWLVLTGEFTPGNFAIGYLIGYLMLLWADRATPTNSPMSRYLRRVWRIIRFVPYFIWTVIVANLRMAIAVLSPLSRLHPAIVAVPLDLDNPFAITLLANWITLTPGTLSLEVAEDRKTLYIHTFQDNDDVATFREDIKMQFERRIMELFE